MSIVAMCPYCRAGGVRAPKQSIGATAICPKCQSSFTIVPPDNLPRPGRPEPPPENSPIEETRPHGTAVDVTEPSPVLVAPAPVMARPAAAPASAPQREGESSYGFALVAVTLFGLGLLASQFAYGRVIGLGITGVGLLMGLGCLATAGRAQFFGGVAVLLNLGATALLLFAPAWLGLEPWPANADGGGPKTVLAVGHNGASMTPADWVDPATASWVYGDVQVTLRSATIGPVELTGPNGVKKSPKEQHLQILVRVANAGVERRIPLTGWAAGTPAAPADVPKLTDPAGKALRAKTFEAGWEAPDRPKPGSLFPGRTADVLFVFELPPTSPGPAVPAGKADPGPKIEFLRFELPGAAVGAAEPVRFHIPGSFVSPRRGSAAGGNVAVP